MSEDDHVHVVDPEESEAWRRVLNGDLGQLKYFRAVLGKIPAGPRCKLCAAPLKAPGSLLLKPLGFGPSRLNRRLCRACFRTVDKKPGGAEIELSLLFADVRGSTALAERIPAQEFSQLISRFYGTAARVVDEWDGIVDKFVGDEVVALFVPGFAGEEYASRAVEAARQLMRETGNDGAEPWIPIGAGGAQRGRVRGPCRRGRRVRLHGGRRRGEHDCTSRVVGGGGRDPREHECGDCGSNGHPRAREPPARPARARGGSRRLGRALLARPRGKRNERAGLPLVAPVVVAAAAERLRFGRRDPGDEENREQHDGRSDQAEPAVCGR